MAKRGSIQDAGITDFLAELDEIDKIATGSEPEFEYVYIRSLIPAVVVWRSHKTGDEYRWENSGAEVKVRKEDADFLLNHKRGGCCGEGSSPSFELVA